MRKIHDRRRALIASAIVLMIAAVLGWYFGIRETRSALQLLSLAKAELKKQNFREAERVALRVATGDKLFGQSRLVAGEAATRAGHPKAAIEIYRRIPRDGSRPAIIAAVSIGELLRDAGQISEAASAYAYVLQQDPEYWEVHRRVAFIFSITGQRWESLSHYFLLLKNDLCTMDELAFVGDTARVVKQDEYLRKCENADPNDVTMMLGLASSALNDGQSHIARPILEKVIAQRPGSLAAHAMLGEILIEADPGGFGDWDRNLPASSDQYPDIWIVRGLWARRLGNLRIAARCFWETLRLDPTDRRATYQLGQVLLSLGNPAAEKFKERYGQLYEVASILTGVLKSDQPNEPAMRRVVVLLEGMGRIWEACAWSSLAARTFPQAAWAQQTIDRHSMQLQSSLPRMLASSDLSRLIDFADFPTHESLWKLSSFASGQVAIPGKTSIAFREEKGIGFDFIYQNGADPETKGVRTFEQMGGGVSVLDYDCDGYPDLFLPQGKPWKTGSKEAVADSPLSDSLFRNIDGARFVDVTSKTAIVDVGFGQGSSAGDFDNDGFPDLYVANVGRNQLYRNNGDGTFTDISDGIDERHSEWTASCVIVDLNADGLPDLFAATYLTGKDVFEVICSGGRACSPKVFEGVPDRLHINKGDGTFEYVPDATPKNDSKGLGVVAFDMQTRGRPALFIANDQVPNFLLRNSPSSNKYNIELEDIGFACGLALTEDGLSVASMGIAADDVNNDGRIDFYVTTFKNEPKVLFLQQANGTFVDATRYSGLREPSFPYVGFGAQFLDADHDGAMDLAVTNGHVEDYRDEGGEYQMRPQFFRNTGNGKFQELQPAQVGEFFERKFLGRGLARLDWNRDGLMDFVVSNVGDSASLVTNHTKTSGGFLNVRLHATTTARDAFGTVVVVETGNKRTTKLLVAGDGYMATNERMLQFGIGPAESVDSVEIRWPSGTTSTAHAVPANATIQFIETRGRGYVADVDGNSSTIAVTTGN